MKKALKFIIPVVIIVAIVAVVVIAMNRETKPKSNLPEINSSEDLIALVEKIYEGQEDKLFPSIETREVDVSDEMLINAVTGLTNGENLEFAVASEPMITSQAYSLVLVKVKDGVDPNEIAKEMNEKINTRKWICVAAEKAYTTSSGNVVCLVMSSEDIAKPIYEKFKELAGTVGQEYEKSEIEPELPEEML